VLLSEGPDPGGVTAQLSASAGGPVWQYENGGPQTAVYIPLRTTRRLDGILGPGCPQIQANSQIVGSAGDITYNDYLTLQDSPAPAPCPPALAGDNLQVVMSVADTGYPTQIVPYVGLFVTQPTSSTNVGSGPQPPAGRSGPSTNPTPHRHHSAHKLTIRVPRTLSVSRVGRGIKVTVNNAPHGKRVIATLRLGSRVLARTVRRSRKNGTVTIILKPARATARRLHVGDWLQIAITTAGARVIRTIRLQTAR
jgi:hypothetical protein